jgi:hypothetical protein
MSIPRIYGHFESNSNTFICQGSNQRIGNCERGFIAWLKHLFGKNVYVDIAITTDRRPTIKSRIYVPLTEVTKFGVRVTGGHIGRAFANALHDAVKGTVKGTVNQQEAQQAQAKQQRKDALVGQYQAGRVTPDAAIASEFASDPDIQKLHQQAQVKEGNDFLFGTNRKEKNDDEAVRLYSLAANQGNAMAQYSLGFMYENGRGGLTKNDFEAVRLYGLAAAQGNAIAQQHIQRLEKAGQTV